MATPDRDSAPQTLAADVAAPPGAHATAAHLPALDGLRGLALLGVLAFHAEGALPGGYLGVDLFFVLSGFLITRLLLAELDRTRRIDLAAFWARRARRLLPALLLMMPAIALYARLAARPSDLADIRWDSLATLLYVANWRSIYAEKSYWDLFAAPSPLQHTWSLAIEEQFYLVWPLIVVGLLRVAGRRGLLALTIVAALASAAAMFALARPDDSARAYFGTDTRATSILSGAVLAMAVASSPAGARMLREPSAPLRGALDLTGAIAAAVIAWAWWRLDGAHPWLYRGGFWVTEACALVLIACALAARPGVVARVLALAPLRFAGTISYGAYLWHWPVGLTLTPERVGLKGLWLEALRFAVTMSIASASHRFFEQPIRDRRLTFRRPGWVLAGGFAVATATVLLGTAPRPTRSKEELLPVQRVQGPHVDRIRISVHGDSTANTLGWALRGLRDPGLTILMEGDDGFNVLGHDVPPWPPRSADARVLMLSGAFLYGIHVEGRFTKACHPEWDRRFEAKLDPWIASAGAEARRLWVTTVPYPLGRYDTEAYRAEVDCINASIRKIVARHPGVRVLDLAALVCPGGTCPREREGVDIRPDGVHFDLEGARGVAAKVLEELERGVEAAP